MKMTADEAMRVLQDMKDDLRDGNTLDREALRLIADAGGWLAAHFEAANARAERLQKALDERTQADAAVSNLLAGIHGDGGHCEIRYGTTQAAQTAEDKVNALRQRLAETE